MEWKRITQLRPEWKRSTAAAAGLYLDWKERRPSSARYAIAILSVILAVLARKQLNSILGDHFPSITFYFAVFISGAIGGWKPGLLALILGAMAADYFFITPRGGLRIASQLHFYGMLTYIVIGLGSISFSEFQWRAQRQRESVVSRLRNEIAEHQQTENKLAAFSKLGQSLSAVATPAGAGQIIGNLAAELFGWDVFSLRLYSLENNLADHIIEIDTINGQKIQTLRPPPNSYISSVARRIMNNGAELILKEEPLAMLPGSFPAGDTSHPSASLMFVPIRDKAKSIGILSIQSYQLNAYNQKDLATLQALADCCGGALQRIQAENEIQRLNAELEQRVHERTVELQASNRELEAFSFAVSHDLRAPLRSVSGFAQALKADYHAQLDDEGREYLERVIQGSRQMDQLINDMLHLSRLSRGELKRQPVNLSALVEGISLELRETEPQRRVEFAIAPGLIAPGDARLMRIALENLLRNAWKFT
ncbi:MAG TPA: histidine kinase dimerization/phospho-acceptor domain-containing protein, partial [Verrucomicrobiae bacterium]|nr:histidine kinase dimerization/phospho-acceptor domain-containing protein [Verrucomicrobiae bacterium]